MGQIPASGDDQTVACPALAARGVTKGFQANLVVDRFSQPLLAAQVELGRLRADAPKQELTLLQHAARLLTEPRACTP
jgi:hypothetical protein